MKWQLIVTVIVTGICYVYLLVTDEEDKIMLGMCDTVHYEKPKDNRSYAENTITSIYWSCYLFCLHWTG